MLLGLGFALFSSPNMNAIMGSVERRFYGIASGMLGTMRLVGQMLSMGIATLLFALYIGRVEITPELYPQFLTSAQTAFAMSLTWAVTDEKGVNPCEKNLFPDRPPTRAAAAGAR